MAKREASREERPRVLAKATPSQAIENPCKLCGKVAQLCRSHIIPEFMYKPLYSEKHKLIGLTIEEDGLKGRLVQQGLYDRLLCAGCEASINTEYEQPMVDTWNALCRGESSGGLMFERSRPEWNAPAFRVTGLDYLSLKLLLLSVLWRASVSSLPTLRAVDLGMHHEARIRQMLEGKVAGKQLDYPIGIYWILDDKFTAVTTPVVMRWNGHRAYQLLLNRIVLVFVVSSHIGDDAVSRCALREDGVLLVPHVASSNVALIRHSAEAIQASNWRPRAPLS